MVIDTHVHLFSPDLARFPYHSRGAYRPSRSASLEEFLPVMEEAGIARAVLVHPEPYLDDHRYVLHCLQAEPRRLKATCLFDPRDAEGARKMANLVAEAGPRKIVAFRIHAYQETNIPDFEAKSLHALCRTAAELGLILQLHFVPRYARAFAGLIRKFPDARVLVDHLGRPGQGTDADYEDVLALARSDRVFIKFSAIGSASKQPYPHRDVGPVACRLVERFGANRIIYGGGYSGGISAQEYAQNYKLVEELLGDLSSNEKERILSENARELFFP